MNQKQFMQMILVVLFFLAFILGWMKFYEIGFFDSNAAGQSELEKYPFPDIRTSPEF
jgi:hypothetical protein